MANAACCRLFGPEMNNNPSDIVGDLLRSFYTTFGMPDEGPPPGVNVTQMLGADAIPPIDQDILTAALSDGTQLRQFSRCREILDELASAMSGETLLRELSGITTGSEGEFNSMLTGVVWFSLAASLDQRRGGITVTPFDEYINVPPAVKVKATVEGSLVMRLYLALVYMREGVLSNRIAHGTRSGLPCCGRVSKLLNSDYVRRIRNALSHGSFSSCVAGIAFRDDNGTIVATPGFMNWLCTSLMLIQLQGLCSVRRGPGAAEQFTAENLP